MKTANLIPKQHRKGSAMVAVLILMLIVISGVAALAAYVTQTVRTENRRTAKTRAIQLAQGGAAVGADDLNRALTNGASALFATLTNDAIGYTLRGDLGTSLQKVFQKTVSSPFSNQAMTVQIWMTNSTSPGTATIKASTTVRDVAVTSTLNVKLLFGFGAAIISDNRGTSSGSVSKSVAQDGNVVVNGAKNGTTVVDGGSGLAIWANGHANVDADATVPPASILASTYGTANQIPDYTVEGAADQLFNFNRFIAVANVAGTHYTNLTAFFAANNVASAAAAGALEGVIVVDIWKKDANFDNLNPTFLPFGVNVRGTLIFNFSSEFAPLDKIVNTATVNINKADMTGFNAAVPSTYRTGYPPTYYNTSKKPSNVDISSLGFSNFNPSDDLPALMYNIGILDIHGNANICGVVYSPSFMEIENKQDNQIQYFKGSLIGGGGIYFENNKASKSVISYDAGVLDLLATSATKGKRIVATYWE